MGPAFFPTSRAILTSIKRRAVSMYQPCNLSSRIRDAISADNIVIRLESAFQTASRMQGVISVDLTRVSSIKSWI